MSRTSLFIACLSLVVPLAAARAEYRVALLLGDAEQDSQARDKSEPELQAVAGALSQYGFRCRIVENAANENALRDAIEGFAATT
ncbi:MAG: hypothetical protein KDA41_00535, partial [Planctomycetales bacterium]|nr:hypothetical protein [Planctomycetales bacterium]